MLAQRIIRRVQRHRQTDRADGCQAVDGRHQTRGAERDPPLRQPERAVVQHEAQRGHHGVEVQQRLAHAHEDDVGDGGFGFGFAGAVVTVTVAGVAVDTVTIDVTVTVVAVDTVTIAVTVARQFPRGHPHLADDFIHR